MALYLLEREAELAQELTAFFSNYARMPYANELAALPHKGFVARRPDIAMRLRASSSAWAPT